MFLSFALFYQWISSDKIQTFIVLSFLYPPESIAKNGSQNSPILQDMFVYNSNRNRTSNYLITFQSLSEYVCT